MNALRRRLLCALSLPLLFAAGFWLGAIALAAWWQRRFGRGPAEYVYRAFGG
jgi:uncharacterized membrane protein YeiB